MSDIRLGFGFIYEKVKRGMEPSKGIEYRKVIFAGYVPSIIILGITLVLELYRLGIGMLLGRPTVIQYDTGTLLNNIMYLAVLPPILSITHYKTKERYGPILTIFVGYISLIGSVVVDSIMQGYFIFQENLSQLLQLIAMGMFTLWIGAFIIFGIWTIFFEMSLKRFANKSS